MKSKNLIEEKLLGNHKNFLKYCQESGKIFVEELDREDFIAYRSEYAVSHEDIEQLKNLLNFQENFSPPQNFFNNSEETLQDYFGIVDLETYRNVLISDLKIDSFVKRLLNLQGYKTLNEILIVPLEDLLRDLEQKFFDNLLETLKKFFKTPEENPHDFQEPVAVESILEESEETLQDYFKITDVTPYENIYIADLDFSVRVKNCLRRNGYKTLDELIKLSRQTLSNLRNLGQNSIDDIFKTLKFFFDTYDSTGANSTEIQPLKKTLQEIFNIVYLPPYEDILITDLDFDNHIKNYLARNNCKTLADLLKLSEYNLLSGFGYFRCNSFDNILKTLKKFFDSRRKKIPAKTLQRANEELDEFLREAALRHDPQIDLIVAAFEDFSSSWRKNFFLSNIFASKIDALPVEIKNKRARLFLRICNFKHREIFNTLPEDLTLAELPAWVAESSLEIKNNELKNFLEELHFDAKDYAQKIVPSLFKDERELEIICHRAQRKTLEEVGKNFGLTRERVRQIESKVINRFKIRHADLKKFFHFIHALTDGKYILTLDDMKKFMDADDSEIIYFLAAKIDLRSDVFHFDKNLNAFVFADGNTFDDLELSKNLPDFMDEETFAETIEFLAREKNCSLELVKTKLSSFYNRSGKIFHRGKLTVTFKFGYILKERFPNGYKIADETFYSRFIRYLQEIFNEETLSTQHNVDATIGKIAVLCDRGKYIHPDFVNISPEIIELVKKFVDDSDRTAIFYKEIFESLKSIFANTQITNHYFLQGAMKFYKLPYTLRKDYLTKSDEINMGKDFDNFVAERGEVSAQEIKENFVSFKDFNIAFLVGRCPEIIRVGDGTFIHATHLDLHEEDFEPIKNFLRQNCSTPINSRILFNLFFERFADFMTRNEIYNHGKLFGVLQYMFRDEFNFVRPYISVEDIKNISNKKVLLRILEDMDEIEIEDLIGICEENGIHYVARNYLIDSLYPDFIRVDEFTLQRPESIGVTDEIISDVVENLRSAVERNGGWQSAQTFEDYEWLPQLEIFWNSFLLESIATLEEDALYKIKIPSTSTNFSLAIFVAEEFVEDDYQSFLTKILIAEHNKEPFRSEKEIFDWLKTQGLCNKKLPKFLQEGRAFDLLGE